MCNKGFTLFELLITLSVIAIVITFGLPSFSSQLHNNKLKTNTQHLFDSIQLARNKAVFSNTRTTIRNMGQWDYGWEVFVDPNNNGERDEGEELIQTQEKLKDIRVSANQPVSEYISFIGSGESRKVGKKDGGALQMGSMILCPLQKGAGFKFTLSSGGRLRVNDVSTQKCDQTQE